MATVLTEEKRAAIEANRKRYDELKAAGQRNLPKPLPQQTRIGESLIPGESVLLRETVPGGWYWTGYLRPGEALRIVNVTGASSVSCLAWNAGDPSERFNYADTVKLQWSAAIQKGRILMSDMGRVMFSVIEDTSSAHDVLAGGSTAASTAAKYGAGAYRNTRDNFIIAAGKLGLDRRDIPPCITFFAPVSVDAKGAFVWDGGKRKPGDFVDLRAEMKLAVVLSNCPHPLDPRADYAPGHIEVIKFVAPPASADDFCRTGTGEAVRAFENTAAVLPA